MCLQCTAKAEYVLIEDIPEEFLPGYTLMVATETHGILGKNKTNQTIKKL